MRVEVEELQCGGFRRLGRRGRRGVKVSRMKENEEREREMEEKVLCAFGLKPTRLTDQQPDRGYDTENPQSRDTHITT